MATTSDAISKAKSDYAKAYAKGDQAGMAAAHSAADSARGYKTDASGSTRVSDTKPSNSNNTDYSATIYGDASTKAKQNALAARAVKEAQMRAAGTWDNSWASTADLSNMVNTQNTTANVDVAQAYAPFVQANNDTATKLYQQVAQQGADRLTAQKADVNSAYNDTAKQAYVSYMQGQRQMPQQMAALGITGGASESSLIGAQSGYENNLNTATVAKQKALSDIDLAVADLKSSGDIQAAQYILTNADKIADNYLSSMQADVSRNDANTQSNLAYQTSQSQYNDAQAYQAKTDAYNAESDAYTRAQTVKKNALAYAEDTGDFSTMLANGWTQAEINAYRSAYLSSKTSGGGGGGAGSSSSTKKSNKTVAPSVSYGDTTVKTTPSVDLGGMMTQSEWARHKNSGNDTSGASEYGSYSEYVAAYKAYAASK